MSEIVLIKNRSDIGAGTRGSDLGIDAIEIAAINATNDYFIRFKDLELETDNESVYNKVNTIFAKRINFVVDQCRRVCTAVEATIKEGDFPIVMSGDHSNALGTLSGVKAAMPDKTIGAIWIDAHADLHSPYTSPSGNIHGMPLAAALNDDNLDNRINNVFDHTQASWTELKNIGVKGPKIKPEHLIFFGVRDTEEAEDKLIAREQIKNYTVAEIRFRGLETCLQEAIVKLSACDAIYISFDVDSLDCDLVSKGTGTPVALGFTPEEALQIIQLLIQSEKVACLEVTEVNPLLDNKGNLMAETAFWVLDGATKDILNQL